MELPSLLAPLAVSSQPASANQAIQRDGWKLQQQPLNIGTAATNAFISTTRNIWTASRWSNWARDKAKVANISSQDAG